MPHSRPRTRLPIGVALAGAFGAIVIAGAGVFALSFEVGRESATALARERTERTVEGIVERANLLLDPVREQAVFLSRLAVGGDLNPSDRHEFIGQLRAALAAAPQVVSLAFIDANLQQVRVERDASGVRAWTIDMQDVPGVSEMLATAKDTQGARWGELVWSAGLRQPLVTLHVGLWCRDTFCGELIAAVSIADLSKFLARGSGTIDANAFVLYGSEFVLAHAAIARQPPALSVDRPLPRLSEIGDPVLASMWRDINGGRKFSNTFGPARTHVAVVNGREYVFAYREISGYGDRPWLVGRHFAIQEIEGELARVAYTAWAGVVILALTAAVAGYFGRIIGTPIRDLARATASIRSLDLEATRPMPGSRLKEIDEAARAYNALIAAMGWFRTYVPDKLVCRLMAMEGGQPALEERTVTVLFTDVSGFTSRAERWSALETASFLNRHFAIIAACVEAEGGTVDKFIGDSMMAFWGAPEDQPDHAARACRAAHSIAAAVRLDNEEQSRKGATVTQIRIGIHTGPAIVGNIGAPGRINYTIVGDTVNVAQRLEALAKEFARSADVVALASSDTVSAAGIETPQLARRVVKGRAGAVNIHQLV